MKQGMLAMLCKQYLKLKCDYCLRLGILFFKSYIKQSFAGFVASCAFFWTFCVYSVSGCLKNTICYTVNISRKRSSARGSVTQGRVVRLDVKPTKRCFEIWMFQNWFV